MAKKNPWEGLDLAGQVSPSGQLDQQLFQSRPRPEKPVAQDIMVVPAEPQKQGNTEASLHVSVDTSKQENPLPSPPQKATFALPTEVLDALDDIKLTLKRSYGIRLSKEKIVAEAIQQLSADLSEHKKTSLLVNKYSREEGNK